MRLWIVDLVLAVDRVSSGNSARLEEDGEAQDIEKARHEEEDDAEAGCGLAV